MKLLLIISLVFSLFCPQVFAQKAQAQKAQAQKQIKPEKANTKFADKSNTEEIDNWDARTVFGYGYGYSDKLVSKNNMPTIKPSANYYANTPVIKISGRNLAPMPGTEPLDMFETKQDTFAKKNRIIKITTFPPKEETKSKANNSTLPK